MATRLYPATLSSVIAPSAWSAGWNKTAGAVTLGLYGVAHNDTSGTNSINAASGTSGHFTSIFRMVSPPLFGNQTIAGTIKGQFKCMELSGTDNFTLAVAVKVLQPNGSDRGVCLAVTASDDTTNTPPEFPLSTPTNRGLQDSSENKSITLSSVSATTGDCIVVEIGFRQASTSIQNGQITWGNSNGSDLPEDDTSTSALNSWIEFSNSFVFSPYFFDAASNPADGAATTNTADPTAVTPPSGMRAGDLVCMIGHERATTSTLAVSAAGGQTWNTLTAIGTTTVTARVFWCIFNGTWGANPSVDFGGTTCNSVQLFVFRPQTTNSTWAVNQAQVELDIAAAATQTITGQTTTGTNPLLTLAGWFTADDNTWGSISGTGWVVTSVNAQYRNTSGSDQSSTYAHRIQSAAGATGNVAKTQLTLGNDAASTFIISFSTTIPAASFNQILTNIHPVTMNTGGGGGVAYVQSKNSENDASAGNISLAFDNPVGANTLLLAIVSWDNDSGQTCTGVTFGGVAGALAAGVSQATKQQRDEVWYLKNAAAGSTTVQANFSVGVLFRRISIVEVSGADLQSPLDKTSTATGTSNAPSSGSVRPVTNGQYIFGALQGNAGGTITQQVGWNIRVGDTANDDAVAIDTVQTWMSPITFAPSLSSSTSWAAIITTWKAAPAGTSYMTVAVNKFVRPTLAQVITRIRSISKTILVPRAQTVTRILQTFKIATITVGNTLILIARKAVNDIRTTTNGSTVTLSKLLNFVRTFSISHALVETDIKQSNKIINQTVSNTLSRVLQVFKIATNTVVNSLSAIKAATKIFDISKVGGSIRQFFSTTVDVGSAVFDKILTTVNASAISLSKSIEKIISSILSQTVTRIRSVSKILIAALSQTLNSIKNISHIITTTLGEIVTRFGIKALGKLLTTVSTNTLTLLRVSSFNKLLTMGSAQVITRIRLISHLITITLANTAPFTAIKVFLKSLIATSANTLTRIRSVSKIIQTTTAFSVLILMIKSFFRTLTIGSANVLTRIRVIGKTWTFSSPVRLLFNALKAILFGRVFSSANTLTIRRSMGKFLNIFQTSTFSRIASIGHRILFSHASIVSVSKGMSKLYSFTSTNIARLTRFMGITLTTVMNSIVSLSKRLDKTILTVLDETLESIRSRFQLLTSENGNEVTLVIPRGINLHFSNPIAVSILTSVVEFIGSTSRKMKARLNALTFSNGIEAIEVRPPLRRRRINN